MTPPKIETPRGKIVITKGGKATLSWNVNFVSKWGGNYSRAQKFVDMEVLRLSEKYTPLLTGMLVKSGDLGTDVGSGLVQWIAPYAKKNYYSPRRSSLTGPLRGGFWFERMRQVHGNKIIAGARRIAGRS